MFLADDVFQTIVSSTPLISIDLVVGGNDNKFLLGMRNNKPAQNTWFVPGGRVQKNESLDDAFRRLCDEELNVAREREHAEFLGVYEHFYEDSIFGNDVSTHYIVLAYKINIDASTETLPKQQHNNYAWMTKDEVLSSQNVHKHSQWYFQSER